MRVRFLGRKPFSLLGGFRDNLHQKYRIIWFFNEIGYPVNEWWVVFVDYSKTLSEHLNIPDIHFSVLRFSVNSWLALLYDGFLLRQLFSGSAIFVTFKICQEKHISPELKKEHKLSKYLGIDLVLEIKICQNIANSGCRHIISQRLFRVITWRYLKHKKSWKTGFYILIIILTSSEREKRKEHE